MKKSDIIYVDIIYIRYNIHTINTSSNHVCFFLYFIEIKRICRKHSIHACVSCGHTMARGHSSIHFVARNMLIYTDYFLWVIHHCTSALQGRDGGSSLEVGRSHDIILPSQGAPVQFSSQLPSYCAFLLDIHPTRRLLHSLLPIIVSTPSLLNIHFFR